MRRSRRRVRKLAPACRLTMSNYDSYAVVRQDGLAGPRCDFGKRIETKGKAMLVNQAAVLVSGGMDSVAALHWAKERYPELLAISYDYGQKNRDAELTVAQRECEALGVTMLRERLLAFSTTGILGKTIPAHREHGTSPAMNVGRNPLLFTYAVTHACQHFPNGNLDLVIGCNIEDRVAFPDCHRRAELGRHPIYFHAERLVRTQNPALLS